MQQKVLPPGKSRSVNPLNAACVALVSFMIIGCGGGGGGGGGGGIAVTPAPPAGPPGTPAVATSELRVSGTANLRANNVDAAQVVVTARDANGTLLPNQAVSVSVTGAGASVTPTTGVTDLNGNFIAALQSSVTGTKTLTASINPGPAQIFLTQSPTVTFNQTGAGEPNPNQSTVVVNPTGNLNANGVDSSTITVTARDATGATLANQPVTLQVGGGGATISPNSGTTNSSGQFTAQVRSTQPGPKTIQVTIGVFGAATVSASQPVVSFNAAPGTPDPAQSSLTATPTVGVPSDGVSSSTVTVIVRDPSGTALTNQTVSLSASGQNASLAQSSGTTNSSGQFTTTLTSTSSGAVTLSGIVNPGASQVSLTQTPTVTFSAPPVPDANLSTVATTRTSGILADGTDASVVTVTVRDANGSALPNQTVVASTSAGSTILSPSSGLTAGNGEFSFRVTSTLSGNKPISLTINPQTSNVTLVTMPTLVFDAAPIADADRSSVTANPVTGLPASGMMASTITVIVRNSANAPLANQTVQFTATGTGNSLSPTTATTDLNGRAQTSISSTVAGTKVITARVNPTAENIVISQQAFVTFDPVMGVAPSATNSSVTASQTSGLDADGVDSATITVTVRDTSNMLMASQTVRATLINSAGASISPTNATTNAMGVATFTLTSNQSGTKTVRFSVSPGTNEVIIQAQAAVSFNSVLNVITGGASNETLNGTTLGDEILGLGGDDILMGNDGNDVLNGGDDNDTLIGGSGADLLNGGDGVDFVSYADSTSAVNVSLAANSGTGGTAAGDTFSFIEGIIGSSFNDTLTGDVGPNILRGGVGSDTLNGGDGNDILEGGPNGDTLNGGGGTDIADYSQSNAAITVNLATLTASGGDATGDSFNSIEGVIGSNFDDNITGNGNNNTLSGGPGADVLTGGGNNDVLNGGPGADVLDGGQAANTASYSGSGSAVAIDLQAGTISGGDAAGDTYTNIQNLTGSDADDDLFGDNRANILVGGPGNDSLAGGSQVGVSQGSDVLMGGTGSDIIQYLNSGVSLYDGGADADVLVLYDDIDISTNNNRLRIMNIEDFGIFNAGTFRISATDVNAIGQPFLINNTIHTTLFIYDTTFGNGAMSTVVGSGWTLSGSVAVTRALSPQNTTFEVYLNNTFTPPVAIFVDTSIQTRNLTP